MWGHACVAVICCACACGRYSVTLSVRCFRFLSSMCRTSEIDSRCVHLRGSDRCEISYAATLTRSMCRSTFEDPIGVNFIIMLLYSCTQITPRVCTLVLFIIIESVDSINRGERGFPLTQYITNGGISRARYAITHLKHHHRILQRISNRISV